MPLIETPAFVCAVCGASALPAGRTLLFHASCAQARFQTVRHPLMARSASQGSSRMFHLTDKPCSLYKDIRTLRCCTHFHTRQLFQHLQVFDERKSLTSLILDSSISTLLCNDLESASPAFQWRSVAIFSGKIKSISLEIWESWALKPDLPRHEDAWK